MPSRGIDTGIWGEEGFARAGLIAKLLFVRLVTGDDTGSAGALKTRLKRLAADLEGDGEDVTVEQVEQALEQLKEAGLVRTYADGWIWLPKFIWWQAHSEGFLTSAERQAVECPDSLARAIRRAVAKKRTALSVRTDAARTRKKATSRTKREGTPKARAEGTPKAPRAIAPARGKRSGSGTETLTSSSRSPSPPPLEGPAAPPEPEPGAQSPPPGVNSEGTGRVDLDVVEREAPPFVAEAIQRTRRRMARGVV